MIVILHDEGFNISERELMRLRSRYSMLLRANNAAEPAFPSPSPATVDDTGDSSQQAVGGSEQGVSTPLDGQVPEEIRQKRKEITDQLQAQSDERLSARKRRRRTRGWANMGPDPPGPPRFPSETTLTEAQTYLNLDKQAYADMRDRFMAICQEHGIVKKTMCGPERWQHAKNQLVLETPHLQEQLDHQAQEVIASRTLCLDVICTDVSKKIRTMASQMTLAESKNILNINPEEGRRFRQELLNLLASRHFKTKVESGNFEELKAQWMQDTGLAQRIPPLDDPDHEKYIKALNAFVRDIMKRWRDSQVARNPNRPDKLREKPTPEGDSEPAPTRPRRALDAQRPAPIPMDTSTATRAATLDPRIDPSLLQASTGPATYQVPSLYAEQYTAALPDAMPAYFRLSPQSAVEGVPKLWLGVLSHSSMAGLQASVFSFPGSHGLEVTKIEGAVAMENGPEMMWQIDRDDELMAYLAHVGKGKATFVVTLQSAYP